MAIVDFSWSKPDLAAASAFVAPDGTRITGMVGYISPDRTGKNTDGAFIAAALAAGFDFSLAWESYGYAANGGAAIGAAEGTVASAMADARGYPGDAAILFALADPTRSNPADWPAIEAYIRAAKAAGHRAKVGGYGDQALIEHLLTIGAIDFGWQVGAWSWSDSPVCHLVQQLGYVLNQTSDWNKVLKPEYGQWHAHPAAPNAPVEDDMQPIIFAYTNPATGGVGQYVTDGFHYRHLPTVAEQSDSPAVLTAVYAKAPVGWPGGPIADIRAFGVPVDQDSADAAGQPFGNPALAAGLAALNAAVAHLTIPPAGMAVDLAPLTARIDALGAQLAALPAVADPAVLAAIQADLAGVHARVAAVVKDLGA